MRNASPHGKVLTHRRRHHTLNKTPNGWWEFIWRCAINFAAASDMIPQSIPVGKARGFLPHTLNFRFAGKLIVDEMAERKFVHMLRWLTHDGSTHSPDSAAPYPV